MLSLLLILVFFFLQVIKLNYVREQKIVNENDRIQYFGDSFNPFALKSLDLHTHTDTHMYVLHHMLSLHSQIEGYSLDLLQFTLTALQVITSCRL